jgi:hypothetical protein
MATREEWPYPKAFCPVCRRGFADRAQLIGHMFDTRHWRRPPAPDPAGAKKLRQAVEAAEARREGRPDNRLHAETGSQEDGDADLSNL